MLVIYGPTAGLSVGKLFIGALIPGLLLSALYMLYIVTRCWLQPELGPVLPKKERQAILTKERIRAVFVQMIPIVLLIAAVLGSIFAGIATPTEAAGTGAFVAVLLTAAYGRLDWQLIKDAMYETMKVTGFIMLLVIGASIFTSVFTYLQGGKFVVQLLAAVPGGKWGSFAVMMVMVFIFGMFIEWIGSIFIIVPLFTPAAAAFGFDPIWFAICVCIMYQTGFLSPPNAHAVFYLKGIAPPEITIEDIFRGVWPFILLILVGLALCVAFPELILWLPNVMIAK